jgi:hypothetical protein
VISFGLDIVWMAPLADLLLFSIVGLLLALHITPVVSYRLFQ